jgi:serine/threonine protein kinase
MATVASMSQYTIVRKLGEGAYGKALLVTKRGGKKQLVVKEVNVMKVHQQPVPTTHTIHPVLSHPDTRAHLA